MPENQGNIPLIRSVVAFFAGFYRHVAPTALWIGFRVLGVFQQAIRPAAKPRPAKY